MIIALWCLPIDEYNAGKNYHYLDLLMREGPNARLPAEYANRVVHHRWRGTGRFPADLTMTDLMGRFGSGAYIIKVGITYDKYRLFVFFSAATYFQLL